MVRPRSEQLETVQANFAEVPASGRRGERPSSMAFRSGSCGDHGGRRGFLWHFEHDPNREAYACLFPHGQRERGHGGNLERGQTTWVDGVRFRPLPAASLGRFVRNCPTSAVGSRRLRWEPHPRPSRSRVRVRRLGATRSRMLEAAGTFSRETSPVGTASCREVRPCGARSGFTRANFGNNAPCG
jgi:hypothetical protein